MKKPTSTIQERLPQPYTEEVPPFALRKNTQTGAVGIPVFGIDAMDVVQQFMNLAHEMLKKEPLYVFWGLSGSLGCYFSEVKNHDLTMEQLNARITLSKPLQPFSVLRQGAFEMMIERIGGSGMVRKIDFDEAMLIVEGKKRPPEPEYEEPEEEEFDEDCTPACRPGDHKCGKQHDYGMVYRCCTVLVLVLSNYIFRI